MKKWLITGGCGFIGTRLISSLVKDDNNRICVVDNMSVGTKQGLSNVTEFIEVPPTSANTVFENSGSCSLVVGDILDEALACELAKQADVIVHLAANTGVGPSVEDPRGDCNANIIGTLNYLEGARLGSRVRFIFASSGAPLGEVEVPPIREDLPANPVSPYGASKLAGEGYCSAYFNSFGVETVALRFGNVYGPGSIHKSSVVAKFIKKAMAGETLEIYGNGEQTRDFIYLDDLINAIQAAAVREGVGGEKFQIATNRESTVGEVAELLCAILTSHGISDIKLVNGEARVGDVMRNYSDITKAKEQLGWEPLFDLRDGLEQTVSYFKLDQKHENS